MYGSSLLGSARNHSDARRDDAYPNKRTCLRHFDLLAARQTPLNPPQRGLLAEDRECVEDGRADCAAADSDAQGLGDLAEPPLSLRVRIGVRLHRGLDRLGSPWLDLRQNRLQGLEMFQTIRTALAQGFANRLGLLVLDRVIADDEEPARPNLTVQGLGPSLIGAREDSKLLRIELGDKFRVIPLLLEALSRRRLKRLMMQRIRRRRRSDERR